MTDATKNTSDENKSNECKCTYGKTITAIITACCVFAYISGFQCGQMVALGICAMGTIVSVAIILKK